MQGHGACRQVYLDSHAGICHWRPVHRNQQPFRLSVKHVAVAAACVGRHCGSRGCDSGKSSAASQSQGADWSPPTTGCSVGLVYLLTAHCCVILFSDLNVYQGDKVSLLVRPGRDG